MQALEKYETRADEVGDCFCDWVGRCFLCFYLCSIALNLCIPSFILRNFDVYIEYNEICKGLYLKEDSLFSLRRQLLHLLLVGYFMLACRFAF